MSQSPTISMRTPHGGDKARLLAWRNMPEVAQWMYSDHLITADEHERWFAAAMVDPRRRYWIIEADGQPIGLANLYDLDTANGRTAWAYYLADPSVRGKGVGSFVEFWVIEHVFGELGLGKLWCEVLLGNEAVWKLHQAFGFEREALFRQHVRKGGEALDVVGLGLLAADWTRVRPVSAERLRAKGFAV